MKSNIFFHSKFYARLALIVTAWLVVGFSTAALAKHYSQAITNHLESAEHFITLKDYQSAKAQLLLAQQQDPQCTDAFNNLGVIYLRLHQFDQARDYFEQALRIDPCLPTSLSNLAQVYYFLGKYDFAIRTYKEALLYGDKHDYLLLSNLGDALAAQGNYQQAGHYYQEALKVNPNFPQALLGSANLYFHLGSYDSAYQYALQAIRLKPDWALAYYQLGRIEDAKQNDQTALKAYLLSLNYEKNPQYAQDTRKLIADLGIDPFSLNQKDLLKYQASILHENTPAYSQPDEQTILKRAQSNLIHKEWQKAQAELKSLLPLHHQDPVLFNDLGLSYAGQKDYAQAEDFYRKAITASNGKCINAFYNLGQLYRLKGNLIDAKSAFEQALDHAQRQHQPCPLANNALALVLKQLGDTDGALAAYKLALAQGGENYPVIHYNLAILLEKTNQPKEAADQYKLYLKLAPHGFNAGQAQERLHRLIASIS